MEDLNIGIKYKGTVTVKVVTDGVERKSVLHNNGTNNLFRFLCKTLIGELAISEIPHSIVLKYGSGSSYISALVGGEPSVIQKRVCSVEDGEWYSMFTTSIKAKNILNRFENNYILSLLDRKKQTLATIGIDKDIISSMTDSSILIIEWKLQFFNDEESN